MGLESDFAKIPQIARGKVWCTSCGRSQSVAGVDTLMGRNAGWPKCCGYTMTIDSPEERAFLAGRRLGKNYGPPPAADKGNG